MNWYEEEAKSADFGDVRLENRMKKLLELFGNKPSYSIPQACGGWAETLAAYRFFANDKVSFEQILDCHYAPTLARIREQPVVLLPQDTTDLIHVVTKNAKGIGTLKNTEKCERFLHPVLAITPDRVPLGVVSAKLWQRSETGIRKERAGKPIEEKESFRWLEGYQVACDIQAQAPQTLIVSVADRECDIYELFVEMHEYSSSSQAAWIIRSAQDRLLENKELENKDKTAQKLWQQLQSAPALGTSEFTLPASGNRKARQVQQTIRATTVTLKPPARAIKGYSLPPATINAVYAKEENPPEGVEAIEWLLLTCLPISSFEQVSLILEWYVARWEIEIYFRVLKQGCTIEKLQFSDEKHFAACLALYMIIAWRVLYVTMLGRDYPFVSCEALFSKEEWQTLFIVTQQKPPPSEPPPLVMMVRLLAGLGGFLARKHDHFPGTKSIWIGLQRLSDFVWAIQAFQIAASMTAPAPRQSCV